MSRGDTKARVRKVFACVTPLIFAISAANVSAQTVSAYEKRALASAKSKGAVKGGSSAKTVNSYEKASQKKQNSEAEADKKIRNVFQNYFGNFVIDCGESVFLTAEGSYELKIVGSNIKTIDAVNDLIDYTTSIRRASTEDKLNDPQAHDAATISYRILRGYNQGLNNLTIFAPSINNLTRSLGYNDAKAKKYFNILFYRNIDENGNTSRWSRFIDNGASSQTTHYDIASITSGIIDGKPTIENIEIAPYGQSSAAYKSVAAFLMRNRKITIAKDYCSSPRGAIKLILTAMTGASSERNSPQQKDSSRVSTGNQNYSQPIRAMRSAPLGPSKEVVELQGKAAAGNASAAYMLGREYEVGENVPTSLKDAAKWYKVAADQSDPRAQFYYARLILAGELPTVDASEAIHYLELSAQAGFPDAMYLLGDKLTKGVGVGQDIERGLSMYQAAADKGNGDAQAALGEKYYRSAEKSKNYSQALKYLSLAANSDRASAKYYLGMMYEKGLGVPKDRNKAFTLLMSAYQNGQKQAYEHLTKVDPFGYDGKGYDDIRNDNLNMNCHARLGDGSGIDESVTFDGGVLRTGSDEWTDAEKDGDKNVYRVKGVLGVKNLRLADFDHRKYVKGTFAGNLVIDCE